MPVVRKRHYARAASGSLIVAVIGGIAYAFGASKNIDWTTVHQYLTSQFIIEGAWHTLEISVLSMLIGLLLGTVAAIARMSANPVTRWAAGLYVWFFRGTPVLVQLLLWYNLSLIFPTVLVPGLGRYSTNSIITPFVAALLGLGINEGAYMCEIVRGGILSVPDGQRQAAKALGMTPWKIMRNVTLPQAFRVALPGTGNQFVIMLKSSSLASIVQYSELLHASETVYQRNLAIIELLLVASFWYIVLTTLFTAAQNLIERRLGRAHRRTPNGSSGWRRMLEGL